MALEQSEEGLETERRRNMAKVIKRQGKRGVSWVVDYLDPEGKRKRKFFPLKKDAEAYLGKVVAAKRERAVKRGESREWHPVKKPIPALRWPGPTG